MERSYYEEYAILETTHWWFRARLDILKDMVQRKIVGDQKKLNILNVGVASGETSKMLAAFGDVTSLEYDQECCDYLRNVAKIEVTQGSMTELPYEDHTFDLVCAFDVIEHIDDHDKAVEEARRVLKPDGHLFITVPAFQFLWSEHDLINHHFRRYDSSMLKNVLNKSELNLRFLSFFNFFLFPLIFLIRIVSKLKPKTDQPKSDFKMVDANSLSNRILLGIFGSEKGLLKSFRLPFGVSLMAICQKNHSE